MPRTMERAMGTGKIARAEGRFLLSARKGLPNALPTSIASRIWLLSINPSARRFAATAEDCTRPPNCAATAERSSVGKSSVTAWGRAVSQKSSTPFLRSHSMPSMRGTVMQAMRKSSENERMAAFDMACGHASGWEVEPDSVAQGDSPCRETYQRFQSRIHSRTRKPPVNCIPK